MEERWNTLDGSWDWGVLTRGPTQNFEAGTNEFTKTNDRRTTLILYQDFSVRLYVCCIIIAHFLPHPLWETRMIVYLFFVLWNRIIICALTYLWQWLLDGVRAVNLKKD